MPIRPIARLLLTVYVACCPSRRIREECACLRLKRMVLLKRGGAADVVALIDAFLEVSWLRLKRRRLV
jgi:hypothetical protein